MTSDTGDEDILRWVAEQADASREQLRHRPVGNAMSADGGQRS